MCVCVFGSHSVEKCIFHFCSDYTVHKSRFVPYIEPCYAISQSSVDTDDGEVGSLCNVNVKGWLCRQDVSRAVCSAGLNGLVVSSVHNILSVSLTDSTGILYILVEAVVGRGVTELSTKATKVQVLPEKYFFLQRFSGGFSTSAAGLECFSRQHKFVTHYIWLVSSNQQIGTTNWHPGFSFTGFAQCLLKVWKNSLLALLKRLYFRLCLFACWLACHRWNYQKDFHKSWMKNASKHRVDPINLCGPRIFSSLFFFQHFIHFSGNNAMDLDETKAFVFSWLVSKIIIWCGAK